MVLLRCKKCVEKKIYKNPPKSIGMRNSADAFLCMKVGEISGDK